MPLDPIFTALAGNGEGNSGGPYEVDSVRAGYDMANALAGTAELASVEDRTIPGPGGEIPVRVYRPQGTGPHPPVVFFHGGGWTIGSLTSHDGMCRQLAALTPAVVVAVDYRLAPEHPFPAAVDDAWAATVWVADHPDEIGARPGPVAVAGESAGANLATVTAITARDRSGPSIAFQLLYVPTVDISLSHPSITENADGPFLTRSIMEWFFSQYAPAGVDHSDWRLSPLDHPDLSGLPPALILTAEFDPLRDEGEAYAARLAAAGVSARASRYDGMAHTFAHFAGAVPQGRLALEEGAAALREALGAPSTR
ncbi:MAG TPA: alpha/beta hydrolase [Acidimicrobiales bacterium]|nr:alpha/beta hydrolase [Acidimicrobiales bacterium]